MAPTKISVSALLGCICCFNCCQRSISTCSKINSTKGACIESVTVGEQIWDGKDDGLRWPSPSDFLGYGKWAYHRTSFDAGPCLGGGFRGELLETVLVQIGCSSGNFSKPTSDDGWGMVGSVSHDGQTVADMWQTRLQAGSYQLCCDRGLTTGLWVREAGSGSGIGGASGGSCPSTGAGSGECTYKLQNARFKWVKNFEYSICETCVAETKEVSTTIGISSEVTVEVGVTVSAEVSSSFFSASSELSMSVAGTTSQSWSRTETRSVTIEPGKHIIFWQLEAHVDVMAKGKTQTQIHRLQRFAQTRNVSNIPPPSANSDCTQTRSYQCPEKSPNNVNANAGCRIPPLQLSMAFIVILRVAHDFR